MAREFLNRDAVLRGTVASARDVARCGVEDLDGLLHDLTVQEPICGPRTRRIEVFTENSSERFPRDVGKEDLLFDSEFNGGLEIDSCSDSALFSVAGSALRELRRPKIPKDAVIEGRISFLGIPDSGTHTPGVRVIVRSQRKTFMATSNRDGCFHLHAPPGKYWADV